MLTWRAGTPPETIYYTYFRFKACRLLCSQTRSRRFHFEITRHRTKPMAIVASVNLTQFLTSSESPANVVDWCRRSRSGRSERTDLQTNVDRDGLKERHMNTISW